MRTYTHKCIRMSVLVGNTTQGWQSRKEQGWEARPVCCLGNKHTWLAVCVQGIKGDIFRYISLQLCTLLCAIHILINK